MPDDKLRAELAALFEARDRDDMAPTISALHAVLDRRPDDPAVLYEVGGAHDTAGEEETAAVYYQRALDAGLDGTLLRQSTGSTAAPCATSAESTNPWRCSTADAHSSHSPSRSPSSALTLHAAGRPSHALGSVFELIANRFRTDEVIRYETALRGNAAYLASLDTPA
jgi:hypothetical protein